MVLESAIVQLQRGSFSSLQVRFSEAIFNPQLIWSKSICFLRRLHWRNEVAIECDSIGQELRAMTPPKERECPHPML